MNNIELQVSEERAGVRIDRYLAEELQDYTRSYIQKLLKEKRVEVSGTAVKSSYAVKEGDEVLVSIPEPQALEIEPEDIPLDILYEDKDLLVVNKPKGMVVHPGAGHSSGTLVNALLFHCRDELSGINGVIRPGIVHRIDMDTTGALIVCKNDFAHNHIARQLKDHSVTRKYYAIVHGIIKEDAGTVDAPIGRHKKDRKKMAAHVPGGRRAVTHYKVIRRLKQHTLIECQLETGRTHQIRVHMASIGKPVLGDQVYGPTLKPSSKLQGQTLHAMVIGFIHPSTETYMEFEAPLPDYFQTLLDKL